MSKNTTRRLVAVLLALLVACSFAGAPAIAAAGSGGSVGDDVSGTFGSGDDSTDDESTDSNSTDDSSGEESTDDSSGEKDATDDSDEESDDGNATDDSDEESDDGNATDDSSDAENVTEPVDETVNATGETLDSAAETTDETASGAAYRTFELIEATTDTADTQGALALPFDDGEETERSAPADANQPDARLSAREPAAASEERSSDDGSGTYDSEIAVASVSADGATTLSTGGSGGQPLPTGATGGATLGLGVIAAAAVARSTPLVATSGSSGVGSAASGYLSSLLDKVEPFVFPLRYSRYDDSDPLEHEAREQVYEIVNETPGSYLSEVSERAGLPLSTTRHHMKVLEREELVSGAKLRGKRRFYPAYAEGIELAAALNDDSTASIIDALARLGAASVSDLADDLGRDPSTISHHLQRLEEDAIITREREGRAVMNKLSAEARTALEPETTPRPGEAAEAVAD